MSKIAPQLLGYTRTSKPVFVPGRGSPDTNNMDTYRKTKARFADRGADHQGRPAQRGSILDR